MNIGYLVSFRWYPPQGDSAVHAWQVAHQLANRGHRIKTISYWHQAPILEVYRQRDILRFLRDIDVLYIRTHGDWTFEHWTPLKILTLNRLPVVWEINSPLEELITRGMRTEKTGPILECPAQVLRQDGRRRYLRFGNDERLRHGLSWH